MCGSDESRKLCLKFHFFLLVPLLKINGEGEGARAASLVIVDWRQTFVKKGMLGGGLLLNLQPASQPPACLWWSHDHWAKPKKSNCFQVHRILCGSHKVCHPSTNPAVGRPQQQAKRGLNWLFPCRKIFWCGFQPGQFGLYMEKPHNRKALRSICSAGVSHLHSSWLSESFQGQWFLHL